VSQQTKDELVVGAAVVAIAALLLFGCGGDRVTEVPNVPLVSCVQGGCGVPLEPCLVGGVSCLPSPSPAPVRGVEPIPVNCLCHHGDTLCGLGVAATRAHLRHGDEPGVCKVRG